MGRRPGKKERSRITGTFPVPFDDRVPGDPRGRLTTRDRLARALRRAVGAEFLLVTVLCGPVFAYFAYRGAARHDQFVAEAELGDVLRERTHEVESELRAFTETLRSCRSLFDASERVTRAEFAIFTREACSLHPAILAIGWAPRVTDAERSAFEASVARDGPTGYRIRTREPGGTLREAPASDVYFPLLYAEPSSGSERLLGFDLASEDARRDAIRRTLDTAAPAASGPLDPLADPGSGPAADVVLGVYDHAGGTARERAVPLGVLCVAFRFADVIGDRRARPTSADGSLIDLSWSDAPSTGARRLLHPFGRDEESRTEAPYATAHDFRFAGRRYVFRGTPTASFVAEHRGERALLIGTLVLLTWELVGLLLYVIARYWRASSLERQARSTGLLLRSLGEGVVLADGSGRVRVANDAALRMLGVSMDDLRADDWPLRCRLHPSDGRIAYDADRTPLARAARGETVPEEDVRIDDAGDPRGRLLAASAHPLVDDGNVVLGGVMVLRDVTVERRAAESLRRLSRAVEQTTDAVYVTDAAGSLIEANPAFGNMTGFEEAVVLGHASDVFEVDLPDGASTHVERWAAALAGEPFRGDVVHRRRDGTTFEAEQTITPVKDAFGRVSHAVVVMRDTSASRRLQATEVEMRLAAEVQQRLYPRANPEWEGLDVAGAALPAVATCGDYYDYLRYPDGTFVLAIGDVSGHGLGPAILMSETRAYLHSLVDAGVGPSEVFRRVNAQLRNDLVDGAFVTLLLVSIDARTRRVSHTSAGHPAALLFDAAGTLKARLERTGPALGVFDAPVHADVPGPTLEPGDVLVLMTDGVCECSRPDGGFFDEEGVIGILRDSGGSNASTILATIQGAIDALTAGRERRDDITLVVCRSTGEPSP